MKHKRKSIGLRILICMLCMLLCLFSVVAYAAATTDDPLISLSYLDQVFMPKIVQYIDQRFQSFAPNQVTSQSVESFQVVSVSAGQSLICDAGAELILRSGSAQIIATLKGGLANVTMGTDLQNGANMPANQLLVVPVDDGRGITAQTDILVMVKGRYTIR